MRIKPYRPGATESQVMAQVIEAAAMFGIVLERRNTGAGMNPAGRMIRFGKPGDSDLFGTIPVGPNRGRTIAVEVKKEGFVPPKRGMAKAHFERQLSRLRKTNDEGGIAFWVSSGVDAMEAFRRIAMARILNIVFVDGCPYIETGPEGGAENA